MVPIFVAIASVLFVFKEWFVRVAFTAAFSEINTMLIWQLLGDFFKILTLAFGFQTVVKTQVLRYFIIETFFNALYLILALNWMNSSVGVVQAYALAAGGSFVLVLVLFRKQIRTATSG
jgi:PST family polysaccharide transporter